MPTKLKNLKVKKVDFVDQGANPEAHIKIKKNKEESKGEKESVVKRFFIAIAKASGLKQEELESVVEEIAKGDSITFGEKMNEVKRRKVADEIWDMCYALQSSLCSIMFDDDLDSAAAQESMQQSISEFSEIVNECVTQWSQRKTSNIKKSIVSEPTSFDVEKMKELIGKATGPIKTEKPIEDDDREEGEEIMIDKSKMTPAERAFYEEIQKRCSVTEDPVQTGEGMNSNIIEPVGKGMGVNSINSPQPQSDPEDIYKGVHPAVKAELESLRKFREEQEEKELTEVAKKYELLGKKPEELVPVLKSLKAAGGTAYNDMLSVLDTNLDTIQKSGVFGEVGHTGGASNSGESEIIAKMRTKIAEVCKNNPNLTEAQAMDQVLLSDPELLKEFDK